MALLIRRGEEHVGYVTGTCEGYYTICRILTPKLQIWGCTPNLSTRIIYLPYSLPSFSVICVGV